MTPFDASQIIVARDRLAAGQLVAVPTETVYGLAGLASSEGALKRIFALKGRPLFDPLIVHVSSLGQARALASDWNPTADFLARRFWPGPLTVVVRKAASVSSLITAGLDTVAIRWPSHPLFQDLLKLLGEPVAAPSANRFGRTSPSRAAHVRSEFPGADLLILDGGPCAVGVESTVISAVDPRRIEILRPGAVGEDDLRAALARQSQSVEVARAPDSAASPGTLKHHYMPDAPLALAPGRADEAWIRAQAKGEGLPAFRSPRELALSKDPLWAARELYAELRRLSEEGADFIWTRDEEGARGGLWEAIHDRLSRAATYDWRERR